MAKVAICLFSYRGANTNALMGIVNGMIPFTKQNGIDCTERIYGNAMIDRSRNGALVAALQDGNVTHVLFCDDDMLPQEDALVRLVDAELPVISALCTTRAYGDVRIACSVYDHQREAFGQLAKIRPDQIVTGPFAPGTGFLLVDRATIEAVIEYHLSANDWLEENVIRLNRLCVRAGAREAERSRLERLRRDRYASKGEVRVFEFAVSENDERLGEDISFGRKLLRLGIQVAIDPRVQVGHVGEYPYGPWDLPEEA